MLLPIIKEEYVDKLYEFFAGQIQNDLYRMIKQLNKATMPPTTTYTERLYMPSAYDLHYASLLFEVIFRLSIGYKKLNNYTIIEKGDNIGKFSYEQLQGTEIFNYAMVTHPIRRLLNFLTDNVAPVEYELTAQFVVGQARLSQNFALRQYALGNAVELQFVDGMKGRDFMLWLKKQQKADPKLLKEMSLMYVPENSLIRLIGQTGEAKYTKFTRKVIVLKNRNHRGEQIKTWIGPTV